MRALNFALRVAKEILRDPLTVIFGLGFPIVILLLLSAIQANIPVELFEINALTPGVAVFGLSFMALFAGNLIARDRESAFLQRLYASPMRAVDFIIGYTLPLVPIAMTQTLICYAVGFALGLELTANVIVAIIVTIPASILFIAIGLACGSVMSVKAVGGLCGSLVTNLTAWLSGVWFDLKLVGGAFESAANLLPFVHAVRAVRLAQQASLGQMLLELVWVLAYALIILLVAIFLFVRQSKKS